MKFRKWIMILMSAVFLLSMASCQKQEPKGEGYVVHKEYLFGMDEPIYGPQSQVKGYDLEITAGLLGALGVKSFRFRLPSGIVPQPGQVNQEMVDYMQDAAEKLRDQGVTHLIGYAQVFPAYTGFLPDSDCSVPRRDDPSYGEWMQAVSDVWEEIAGLFPEITYWEMGNEFNGNAFFHPNGFEVTEGDALGEGKNGFTDEEKVPIVLDYMYYAAQGIRKGNPEALAVMPGLSPGSGGMGSINKVLYFVEDLYKGIASGEMPYGETKSTDNDDYFDVLGWHPYIFTGDVDEEWLEANHAVYEIAKEYGDDGKKVIFTEFGFTDRGDTGIEERQSESMKTAFEYAQNDMPYLETICAFRVYNCAYAANWGGLGETTFGYFYEPTASKGFSPKAKAYGLQKIFGGTGDLRMFENGKVSS